MGLLKGGCLSHPVYLGIDVGTQSIRVLAADAAGRVLALASEPLISHRDGVRHEQQPEDWWNATCLCCRKATESLGLDSRNIAGIAVDATSGTLLIADRELRPLTNALMYDDARAHVEAEAVNLAGEVLWSRLGYQMQTTWALPKLQWLAKHIHLPDDARLLHQNDFINARLAGRYLASDTSHSLKTGYDFFELRWPADIFSDLDLDLSLFPEITSPGSLIGQVCFDAAHQTGVPMGTPIYAGMTDSCAAQIAAGAVTPGSWNSVLGTTLALKGVTTELLRDPQRVVYSHRSSDGYWLPGGASSTGAGILRREFPSADLHALNRAAEVAEPTSIVVYPLAGRGERFPFVSPDAIGFTLGSPDSTQEHYSAILHGIAYLERLALDYLRHLGAPMEGPFFFTGGAAQSHEWNQIRSNVLGREISVPATVEPALGMAILVASHHFALHEACNRMIKIHETISPNRNFANYSEQYDRFVHELNRRGWLPDAMVPENVPRVVA
jgi:sugar (pentulose or hexulose) kinase